jgi:peptidoglycan/xylan/chitin deacetylase (PgdA/CDA1 family)
VRVPILVYHRITDSPAPELRYYAVRPATFRRQMTALRMAGWRTVDLGRLATARAGGEPLPRRSFVVTFDDAYAELERDALPALRANGQTATVFACSERLGAAADDLRGPGEEIHEDAALMDVAALRRWREGGMAVGSHSATHRRLTDLDDAALAAEVGGSREGLAAALDAEVEHFAYPFGAYDERVVEAVGAAGYATAVTTDPGASGAESAFRLRRVYVGWGEGAARAWLRLERSVRTA